MSVRAIPEGYHSITPYLIIRGAAEAIEFYKKAFGATERMRFPMPGSDKLGHAEIQIGDSIVMLADEMPEMNIRGPQSLGGSSVSLLIYVEDVDKQFEIALAAGAKQVRPLADQFYGDRSGVVEDPYGHVWSLATHVEDIPEGEIQRRMKEWKPGE
ncbi:MAG: VOC family protein [Pirellulales bacterium]